MLWLRVLEILGVRRLYSLTGGGVSGRMLPAAAEASETKGWSQEDVTELFEGARYFGIANFVRLLLHIPVIAFLCYLQTWGWVAVFGAVCFFHILCVVLEAYKTGVGKRISPDPDAVSRSEQSVLAVGEALPRASGWWRNRSWETERLYHWLGMGWFQEIVTTYVELTRLNRFERRKGERVEYLGKLSPADLARFEAGTRLGELAHLIFAVLDLPPVVIAVTHHKWAWLPYLGALLWGDSWLALLQRFHRLRVTGLLEKYRAREARKQKQGKASGAKTFR